MGALPKYLDHNRPAPPIDVLTIRAHCRAYLWHIGDMSLHDAVDALESYCQASGLARDVGIDLCQQIIASAFEAYRREVFDA